MPFSYSIEQLQDLVDPKSYAKLQDLGGTEGLVRGLQTDLDTGLTEEDAVNAEGERRTKYGINILPPPPSKTLLQFMLEAAKDKTLVVLTCASVVSIGIGVYKTIAKSDPISLIDGFAILIAVIIVIGVNSINDYKKQSQFRKLNSAKDALSVIKVIRDSQTHQIAQHDLVVGDIVIFETGDVIPADAVLFQTSGVKTDESSMTGESDAIKKNLAADPFMLSGTKVIDGMGKGVIIAVGTHSMYGKSMMSLRVDSEDTPLQVKLGKLATQIAYFGGLSALVMIVTLYILYFIRPENRDPNNIPKILDDTVSIFITAVTVVVVSVPEGLPMAVMIALAYGTIRMLKDNNLVRHLAACETMGNATNICSDKTGTLTLNQMTVVKGIIAELAFERDDVPHGITSFFSGDVMKTVLAFIAESININSTAYEGATASGKIEFIGSKTEVALLEFTKKCGFPYTSDRNRVKVVEVVPFSSERKRMSTIVEESPDPTCQWMPFTSDPFVQSIAPSPKERYWVYSKGASEIILGRCSSYLTSNGTIAPLTLEKKREFEASITGMASGALRTIGVAARPIRVKEYVPPDTRSIRSESATAGAGYEYDGGDMILLAIVGIQDPVRPEVPQAVASCQRCGITVRMVTGDNVVTARAIATQCGILTPGGIVMEGPEFRKLTSDQMNTIVPRLQVLARSSPKDKQTLVAKLKELGETVAVTGDGTNDAPALKLSDVGFAMGIAGTEIAKEASDIILMDDNFASIVKAVMWGRSVYDAVRKFLQFQLTVNISAVTTAIVSGIISTTRGQKPESVLTAVQLLWVNLIMDTFAALGLATDPPRPSILRRKPHKKTDPLIDQPMWKLIVGQGVYQIGMCMVLYFMAGEWFGIEVEREGVVDEEAFRRRSALVFNSFVFAQLFNELNARVLGNK
ncbi:Calcium-transporting ATPase 10, plasma membrane-type, partial [Quaeritorhiza haematococci]